jgi:hypothetical protein
MKKSEEQEPQGFDVFKTASAVIGSTFGKTPVRTWLAKPSASAAKKRAPRKKAVSAVAPARPKTHEKPPGKAATRVKKKR